MSVEEKNIDVLPDVMKARQELEQERFGNAQAICAEILNAYPDDTEALHILSRCFLKTGRNNRAINTLEKLCSLKPDCAAFHGQLGDLYRAMGFPLKAMRAMSKAVIHDPKNAYYQMRFCGLTKPITFNGVTEHTANIREAVQICLTTGYLPPVLLSQTWHQLLGADKDFMKLLTLVHNSPLQQEPELTLADIEAPLNDAFLLTGMKRLLVAVVPCERLLTFLRRTFLLSDGYSAETFLPFLCALAEQCSMNEYIYPCTKEERDAVSNIEKNLDLSAPIDATTMAKIALIGCYKELVTLDCAKDISHAAAGSGNDAFPELIKIQIDDPLKVRSHYSSIPDFCEIQNAVSISVEKQYEENPYPSWRYLMPMNIPEEKIKGSHGKSVLVAGCGTGQEAISTAMGLPKASVLGIDLSIPSLAYGKQKAIEFGVKNIEFMHGDILALDRLGRQFDMVTCCGVLHHMEDPVAGWRKLLTCLKPDGILKIALYSERAREHITLCREWIKEQGFEATAEGISAFRQAIIKLDDSDQKKRVTSAMDFYAISTCRDLVFHVQEHQFTFLQIQDILDELDLELISLRPRDSHVLPQYLLMFPQDPEAKNLANWHEYEKKNPMTFKELYTFFCHKKGSKNRGTMPEWIG